MVHRGSLGEAIAAARPDVVLTHWLNIGERVADELADASVPLVVRGHGFDFDLGTLGRLVEQRAVRRVYVFPHLYATLDAPENRVRPLEVGFDAERYTPAGGKDRLLVVRGGVAIPTKDYETFFEVASRCRTHRFVLCLAHAQQVEGHLDEVVARRDETGAPVEIRMDVSHDEMAELVAAAGIYLHTHGPQLPFGMPVSIAESMATGAYVIARDLPGCRSYLDGGGDVYADATEAAALIDATLGWDDRRWRAQAKRSIERAFSGFTNVRVAETMLRDWSDSGLIPSWTREWSGGLRRARPT
jgi:glycosyltransferase involved in cell wall biosynthesis